MSVELFPVPTKREQRQARLLGAELYTAYRRLNQSIKNAAYIKLRGRKRTPGVIFYSNNHSRRLGYFERTLWFFRYGVLV